MKKRNDIYVSQLTCPKCGGRFPIPRKAGMKREKGHVKNIWCPYCKEDRKFVENYKCDRWGN